MARFDHLSLLPLGHPGETFAPPPRRSYYHIERIDREENAHLYERAEDGREVDDV